VRKRRRSGIPIAPPTTKPSSHRYGCALPSGCPRATACAGPGEGDWAHHADPHVGPGTAGQARRESPLAGPESCELDSTIKNGQSARAGLSHTSAAAICQNQTEQVFCLISSHRRNKDMCLYYRQYIVIAFSGSDTFRSITSTNRQACKLSSISLIFCFICSSDSP
jgi:hypothetical protein